MNNSPKANPQDRCQKLFDATSRHSLPNNALMTSTQKCSVNNFEKASCSVPWQLSGCPLAPQPIGPPAGAGSPHCSLLAFCVHLPLLRLALSAFCWLQLSSHTCSTLFCWLWPFFVTGVLVGISCRRSRSFSSGEKTISLVKTNDRLYIAKVKHYIAEYLI